MKGDQSETRPDTDVCARAYQLDSDRESHGEWIEGEGEWHLSVSVFVSVFGCLVALAQSSCRFGKPKEDTAIMSHSYDSAHTDLARLTPVSSLLECREINSCQYRG